MRIAIPSENPAKIGLSNSDKRSDARTKNNARVFTWPMAIVSRNGPNIMKIARIYRAIRSNDLRNALGGFVGDKKVAMMKHPSQALMFTHDHINKDKELP